MDVAIPKTDLGARVDCPPESQQGAAGTSSGVNIQPGSDDDGWIVPKPVTLTDGTRVQLFKDGEALKAAHAAIKNARRRICLEVYIFADDPTGRAFADLLSQKARDGLQVFVVYDSFGSIGTDREMFAQMRRSGIRLEEFHPIRPWEGRYSWRPFNRDHRKLLVADDDVAWMGGLNIGGEYAGSWVVTSAAACEPWRDTSIGIRGPSARYYLKAFAKTWRYVNHGGRIRAMEHLHGINKETIRRGRPHARLPDQPAFTTSDDLNILASVPTTDSPLRPAVHQLLRQSKQSIQLTMAYFAPDDELIDALCLAAKRGVRVDLMLPAKGDVKALIIAARSFYAKLLEAGVRIYERQGAILHAKTMVIDGRISVVGSTNLDYRSIEYNCEISTVIDNPTFGGQMQELFANDIRYAKRISLTEWRRRPYSDRVVQWMVNRARYLL